MSEAESPIRKAPGHEVTVEDVRQLMGASTPHFALQLRNRIRTLIRGLSPEDPARLLGEFRGAPHEEGLEPLPSLSADGPGPSSVPLDDS